MSGIGTPNLPASPNVDDVIGNSDGNTVRVGIARLAAIVSTLQGPSYQSRAQLYADLDWAAGSMGSVWGDAAEANKGVYRKSGAAGLGSWVRVGDLPVSAATGAQLATKADQTALNQEISQRIAAIRDAGVMSLTNVGGKNAITAELTSGLVAGGATISGSSTVELIPAETSDGPVTLNIDGGGAIPVRDAAGNEVQVGALVTGRSYFLRRRGSTWRVIVGGVTSVELRAEAASRQDGDAAEAAARIAATSDTGVLPLTNVAGTDTITAALVASSGVTVLSASSTVELIPTVTNTAGATLNVGGAGAWPVQRRDGSALGAGDLAAGRSYLLRRRGNAWRIIGLLDSDVQAKVDIEASARIAATRDTGVLPLTSIAGGDAITADLAASSGVTALSATSTVELIPTVTNTGGATLNVGGAGAWPVQRRDGSALVAGDLVAGRSYLLRRRGNAWRIIGLVDSDMQGSALLAQQTANTVDAYLGLVHYGNITSAAYSATTQGAGGTALISVPVAATGYLHQIKCQASGAGTLYVQRYAPDDGSGKHLCLEEQTVPLVAGENIANVSGKSILFRAGDRIGWRTDGCAIALSAGGNNSSIYFVGSPVTAGQQLADTTTQSYQAGIRITLRTGAEVQAGVVADQARADVSKLAQTISAYIDVASAGSTASAGYRTSTMPDNLSMILAASAAASGQILSITGRAAIAGQVMAQVFSANADATQHTCVAEYALNIPVGDFALAIPPGALPFTAGQHLGIRTVGARVHHSNSTVSATWGGGAAVGATIATGTPTQQPFPVQFGIVYGYLPTLDERLAAMTARMAPLERPSAWPMEIVDVAIANTAADITATIRTVTAPSKAEKATSITATFAAAATGLGRYDLLTFNPATGAVAVVAGAEKARGLAGWVPARPRDGSVVIAAVRLSDGGIVQIIPYWRRERSGWSKTVVPALHRARASNLAVLPRWSNRIRARQPLKILSVGDSITQTGAGTASMATPNGTGRDTISYLTGQQDTTGYTPDYVAAVPRYIAAQIGRSDAGTDHAKIGQVWRLVDDLVDRGYTLGADLTYDNFAVSAKNTYDLIGDDGAPTAWGAAVEALITAQGHHLVILTHGMNEQGSVGTWGRLTHLARRYQNLGAEVVICDAAQPRSSADRNGVGRANVRRTRAQTWQAANSVGAAHVSWAWLDEDDCFEGLGIADTDLGAANGSNHPGIEELAAMGRIMSHVLLP